MTEVMQHFWQTRLQSDNFVFWFPVQNCYICLYRVFCDACLNDQIWQIFSHKWCICRVWCRSGTSGVGQVRRSGRTSSRSPPSCRWTASLPCVSACEPSDVTPWRTASRILCVHTEISCPHLWCGSLREHFVGVFRFHELNNLYHSHYCSVSASPRSWWHWRHSASWCWCQDDCCGCWSWCWSWSSWCSHDTPCDCCWTAICVSEEENSAQSSWQDQWPQPPAWWCRMMQICD